jgi:hypothetical protein
MRRGWRGIGTFMHQKSSMQGRQWKHRITRMVKRRRGGGPTSEERHKYTLKMAEGDVSEGWCCQVQRAAQHDDRCGAAIQFSYKWLISRELLHYTQNCLNKKKTLQAFSMTLYDSSFPMCHPLPTSLNVLKQYRDFSPKCPMDGRMAFLCFEAFHALLWNILIIN